MPVVEVQPTAVRFSMSTLSAGEAAGAAVRGSGSAALTGLSCGGIETCISIISFNVPGSTGTTAPQRPSLPVEGASRNFPHGLPVHHRPLLWAQSLLSAHSHQALLADLWVKEHASGSLPCLWHVPWLFTAGLLSTLRADAAATASAARTVSADSCGMESGTGRFPAWCHPCAFKLCSPPYL